MRTLLSILLLITMICVHAATVTFPATATVRGAQIVLGEVATVEGSDNECTALTAITLAPSPIPGQSFTLTPGMVRLRLRAQGIDPDGVTLVCPDAVAVTRQATVVTGATLVENAHEWLRSQGAPGEDTTYTPLTVLRDLTLPAGTPAIACAASGTAVGTVRAVAVTVTLDGMQVWQGLVSFRLQRYAVVLVTKTAISRNQPLDAARVEIKRCEITHLAGTPLTDLAELEGFRAAATLAAGQVLTTQHLAALPLVRRNEPVRVQARCGGLLISLTALACEDGVKDALIHVRNPQTRQEFSARVTGPGEVELTL